MEEKVLVDPEVFPTDDVIFSHIRDASTLWKEFFALLHETYPDFEEEWRYYRDGNSWLMKVIRKKKTIFWLSVIDGAFRITCYFTDRAEESILASSLSDELKEQFTTGKYYGKIRALTITMNQKSAISYAMTMVGIKRSVK